MAQVQGQTHVGGGAGDGENEAGQVQAQLQAHDAALDDLLAEIDGVLEQNAESFVRGFVQKGGQ